MAELKISQMTQATEEQLTDGALMEVAVEDGNSSTGYSTKSGSLARLKEFMVGEVADELLANQNGGYVRKNLLPCTVSSKSQNGGTFTVNSDGSVRVAGTFTGRTNLTYFSNTAGKFQKGTYIISGCPSGGATNTYMFHAWNQTQVKETADTGYGATLVYNGTDALTVEISVYAGTYDLTFYPMVRPATIEDGTYVPYAPSNSALNADLLKSLTYNRGDSFSLFLKTAVIVSSTTVFRFQIPLNKPFGSTITSDSNLSIAVGSATLFQSAGSYAVAASDIASVAAVRRTIAIEVTVTLSAAISGLTAARATTGDINLTVNFT